MQKLFSTLLLSAVLFSCSEKEFQLPKEEIVTPIVKEAPVFYKDPNISIKEVKATQTANGQVSFSFTTNFENNLKSIEVYSGASSALLCEIYSVSKNGSSTQLTNYSVVDKNIEIPVIYYMIKYTTMNNEWSVSPLHRVELK